MCREEQRCLACRAQGTAGLTWAGGEARTDKREMRELRRPVRAFPDLVGNHLEFKYSRILYVKIAVLLRSRWLLPEGSFCLVLGVTVKC